MADYLTFLNIINEVQRGLKLKATAKLDLIKMIINMVYLDEVMACDSLYPFFWLRKMDDSLASKAPTTITAINQSSPGDVATAHSFVTDDIVSLYNVGGMTEINNRLFRAVRTDGSALTLKDLEGNAIDTTGYTAYTSGGTVHHRGLTLATTSIDVQKILHAKWHDKGEMTSITSEETEEKNSYLSDSTSRPKRYLHKKSFTAAGAETNQLIWFPASDDAYDLRYWAEIRVAKMANDTDVPLLPPQFHHAIVAGALVRLAESEVQVENQVVWPGVYAAQLKALKSFNREFYEQSQTDLSTAKPYLL